MRLCCFKSEVERLIWIRNISTHTFQNHTILGAWSNNTPINSENQLNENSHFINAVYIEMMCVIQEQQTCHPRRRDRRIRCQYQHQRRRKHKWKRGKIFHVVHISTSRLTQNKRPPAKHQQSLQSLPYSHHVPWSPIHRKDEPGRSEHSSDITSRELPTHLLLNSKWYGRWSRWSPCSISCTTQRYRFVCVTYTLHSLQSISVDGLMKSFS